MAEPVSETTAMDDDEDDDDMRIAPIKYNYNILRQWQRTSVVLPSLGCIQLR